MSSTSMSSETGFDILLNSLLAFFIADTPIGRIIGTPAFIGWLKVRLCEDVDEIDSLRLRWDLEEYTKQNNRGAICVCDMYKFFAFAKEENLSEELADKIFSFIKSGVKFIAVSYSSGCSQCYFKSDC